MEKSGVLNFEVGQLAETKSFIKGYRGAWFRCKIKDIQLEKNKILPEYYDFDSTKLVWEKIYQVPPNSKKSKNVKKHLKVRPQYPMMYKKSEMPPLDSISQVCVVYDGTWKVGDLVDWFVNDCYWSVTIVKVLSNGKFQVESPMPPLGEGKAGEEGIHEACGNDFRPTLEWSETQGWTLPSVEGHTTCGVQLIFPTKQGMHLEPNPAGSTTHIRDSEQNEISLKMDCDLIESSESSSSLLKKVAVDEVEKRELNIMHEDTLEAAVLDLEELVTKVKWLQRLLQSPSNDATPPSWKFA